MTIRKRTKNSRHRGTHTHGWGAKKKHRGAGHRGGRGNASTGKRSDARKPCIWKDPEYFGKHGFKMHGHTEVIIPVNMQYFEDHLNELVSKKLVEQKGNTITIDVEKLGYNKVLGTGKLTKKYKVTAPYFSENAIAKIQEAGGEIIKTTEAAEETEKAKTPEKKIKQEE